MIQNMIIGNWKMNQSLLEIGTFFNEFEHKEINCTFGIAAQAIHIPLLQSFNIQNLLIGSQTCSEFKDGAYTGEISPVALNDMLVDFTLIGHSERRTIFNETNHQLNAKIKNALANNLQVIFCVGETLNQRNAGETLSIIENQLAQGLKDITQIERIHIAYEPVWAIGTGVTASPEQAGEVHDFIRNYLEKKFSTQGTQTTLLYGGSVNTNNINELLTQQNINGALVGGASLKAKSFSQLCTKASQTS